MQKFAEVDKPEEDHSAVVLLLKVFRVCLHPFPPPSLPPSLPLLPARFPPFLTLLHSVSLFHTLLPMVVDMCLGEEGEDDKEGEGERGSAHAGKHSSPFKVPKEMKQCF
ncbi:unnamed protein product [Pleuronectes platessa]|uniref:Uncharacterized protein n=1 Tax=Pleuronectes platessa TaxID=8262 RepID=A0A9N7TIG1_PLEPL|nr:unnamed protein product [Pleuronectes platessa]